MSKSIEHHLGCCPTCCPNKVCTEGSDQKWETRNIGRDNWMLCKEHKQAWLIGENLFSSWREENESVWEANYYEMEKFEGFTPNKYNTFLVASEDDRTMDEFMNAHPELEAYIKDHEKEITNHHLSDIVEEAKSGVYTSRQTLHALMICFYSIVKDKKGWNELYTELFPKK